MLVVSIAAGAVTLPMFFCSACLLYYRALWLILIGKGTYDEMRKLCGASRESWSKGEKKPMSKDQEKRLSHAIWLHTLALNFELWSKPHYRADSLRDDLAANFSNIAFPGTGFSMKWVCFWKSFGILYFILCHPWIILAATCVIWRSPVHKRDRTLGEIFEEELLAPKHWFALWRINSTLVAKHHFEHQNKPDVQAEYRYENKWDFLELALQQSQHSASDVKFKVTPIIANIKEMVCKHKNIEGGMGIHMFKNALHGGDWIIQERLYNCDELQELLPAGAPLSTFRVLTMVDPTAESYETAHKAMTFVFRAGRAGKDTDHSSILYAVDPKTLTIQSGKMFSNWYQVGRPGFSNLLSKQQIEVHPDTHKNLSGKVLSCAHDAVDICIDAHRRLMPNVPTIGWDVAVAKEHGAVLLEANLSCNFFGGIYDRQHYLRIVDTYYANDCRPKLPSSGKADPDQLKGA
mmetsp:Transcript_118864/g.185586  ORF Transcript_118864/g.185586 Transcript_118864/m.185586 type:complete len:462 (-) Transcript_118864:101-1486(-)